MSHCTATAVATDDSMPRAFPKDDDPLSQGEKLAQEQSLAAQIPSPALSAENQTKHGAIWSLELLDTEAPRTEHQLQCLENYSFE